MNRTNKNSGRLSWLTRQIWILNYSLEEARQRYAGRQHFVRQAAVCLILALLRLVGARYA